jgi:hypothetical protein
MSFQVLRLHESGATPYPQRTDFAIPLLEGGHTEAASITKASSAWFCRFRFNSFAEEAFVASPSLVQHSHLVPA